MSALRFCGECNNMLYPREDKDTRILLYACQTCEHQEIATDTCVYKRVLHKPAGEPKDLLKDAATDPSLPLTRSVRCYNCNHPEAAFFPGPNYWRGRLDAVLHLLQPELWPQVEGLRSITPQIGELASLIVCGVRCYVDLMGTCLWNLQAIMLTMKLWSNL